MFNFSVYLIKIIHLHTSKKAAGVAKLVDVPDLGSGVLRRGGSSPSARTNRKSPPMRETFFHQIQNDLIFMATVSQETIGVQHEKITVQLTKEDYLPAVDKALKQYSKKAQIPGFRAGMVPAGVIRKMYGPSIFSDEVLRVAGTKLEEHLINNKAEIFARPIPSESQAQMNFDVNDPQDYTFEFEIGTRPHFEIPLLSGSETMPFYKVIVSDDMIRQEIEKLQYKAGEMTEPETVTSQDNVLNVVFEELDADGQVLEGGLKKDNSLLVKYFSDALQQQLMDKKAGDFIIFTL